VHSHQLCVPLTQCNTDKGKLFIANLTFQELVCFGSQSHVHTFERK